MTDIDEFRSYLKIDKHALDQELVEQPMLYFKISEAYVQAAAERDMLKEQLSTIDAKLDGATRSRLDRLGDKYTEAMVKNDVQTDKKHETAVFDYLRAKRTADELLALKDAFHQRSYMLRDLCSLYTSNYFEESSVKGTGDTDRATYVQRRQKLSEGRKRRD